MELREKLDSFINAFYGYGNLKSDTWFIGMEEGGGNTIEEIKSRLEVWEALGAGNVVDAYEFHKKITDASGKNFDFLFRDENPANQRTWRGLIKLLLSYKAGTYSADEIKKTQSAGWGRLNSDNCLLELFPLPSPNAKDFNYTEWLGDFDFDRVNYKKKNVNHRIEGLRNLIKENEPKMVVFYGKAYGDKYKAVAGLDGSDLLELKITSDKTAKFFVGNPTSYVFIPHPTSHGMSDIYYQQLGKELKERIG
ncbi:MAG: hypothetical protein WD431_01630 [Cyclobacteriaceae bacterium]